MIKVDVEIVKDLPVRQINQYIDDVVFNAARITLDFTNSKRRFPYLTGELQKASMAEGVVKEKHATYHLGAAGVDYAPAVWKMKQNTNWTNPNTYAQWYITEFKNDKEVIMQQAVSNAKGKLK